MGNTVTQRLDNGTTNKRFIGVISNGITNMTYNGSPIATSQQTLLLGQTNNDRINFEIKIKNFEKYSSFNSVKLIVKTTSSDANRVLYLTKETSSTSNDNVKIDEFKTVDGGITYELDFAKYVSAVDGETLYFSVRSSAVAYVPSQFYDGCPELVVNYVSANQGLLNQKYISGSVGRALNYSVNTRNGQPFFTKQLISLEGNLMPLNLSLLFNGMYTTQTWFAGMPYGWKTNYHQKIVSNNDGTKTYTDAQGVEHIFERALNTNVVYFDIAGTGLYLTTNSNNTYTIYDGYNNSLEFNENGYLKTIRKTIGNNSITTILEFDDQNRIIRITDGAARKYWITYNDSSIVIRTTGESDIVLSISGNKLANVSECGGRYSQYSYTNDYLSMAVSDNGEKSLFTYDTLGRIIKIEDFFVKTSDKLIDKKELFYQLTTTVVSNKKGLKIQYSFNTEGECVGEYEVVSNGDGSFKNLEKTDFEAFRSVVIKDKYYEFANGSASNQTIILSRSAVGGMSVNSLDKYIITFKYNITGAKDNKKEAQHKLLIYQSSNLVCSFDLDPRINYEKNESILFQSTGNDAPTVKLVHLNNDGTTEIKDIRIYKAKFTEVHDCIDKYCGGGWALQYTGGTWHQIPSKMRFTYYDMSSFVNVELNKPMTLIDIEENQKNYKQNSTIHHIWFNKKRGMIANTRNVSIITNSGTYALNGFVAARVTVTKKQKHWQYKEYPATLSDVTKLRYEHECILRDGVYNSASTFLNSDFLPITKTGFDGVNYSYTYDPYGNVLTVTMGQVGKQNRIVNTYSYYNLLETSTVYVGNAQVATTSYTYDSHGRVKSITQPDNSVVKYNYDYYTGYLTEVYKYVSGVTNRNVIKYDKDNVGTVLSDNLSGYQFTKDQYNLLSAVKGYNSGSTSSFISFVNQLENTYDYNTIKYNDNFTEEFTYDKYGNFLMKKYGTTGTATTPELKVFYSDDNVDLVTTTDPTHTTIKKTKNSKLRKIIDCRTNNTQKYYYVDGLLGKIFNTSIYDISNKQFVYDELDRLKTETTVSDGATVTTNLTYRDTDLSNLNDISLIEADIDWNYGGTVKNASYSKRNVLDSSQRVTEDVVELGNYSHKKTYKYKVVSNYFSTSQPEKVTYTLSYLSNSSTLGDITYTYDNMGNIIQIVDTVSGNTINYTYDVLGRIIREDNSKMGVSKTWTYDQHGNITSRKEGAYTTGTFTATSTINYSYNSYYTDRLSSYKGGSVNYDANGNILQCGDYSFSWTRGKLLNSCTKSGMNYTFSYNAYGLRVKKYHSTTEYTDYIYDGSKLVSEHRVSGSENYYINYIYAGNEVIGFTYKNNSYYFVKNIQGDIIKLMNSTNNVVATYVYDAWGNCTAYNSSGVVNTSSTWTGNVNPFRYRGYYYDVETQLYWVSSRYYSPELCRWISPDSIEYLDPESINGLNLYAYCNNDPVNKYDPTGHIAISLIVGLVVSFAIGTTASAISQYVQYGDVNWLQAGVDGLFAVASTALAYTGIGLIGSIAAGAGMGLAQYTLDSAVFHDDFSWSGALIATGLGALGGLASGRGAQHFKSIGSNLDDTGRTGVKAILTAFDKYGTGAGYQKVMNLWGGRVANSLAKSISQNFTKSALIIWGTTAASYGASYGLGQINWGF